MAKKKIAPKQAKKTVKKVATKKSSVKRVNVAKKVVKKTVNSRATKTAKKAAKRATKQTAKTRPVKQARNSSQSKTRKHVERGHHALLSGHHRPHTYNRPLLMLPFDHRASFSRDLLGVIGTPNAAQRKRVTELKDIVYHGFRLVANDVPDRGSYAILADHEYAAHVLHDARKSFFTVAMPVEMSGQEEFQFDTPEWRSAIEQVQPHIVKALVRYNPRGDKAMNARQLRRLKMVADYCHKTHRLFLFELLVPPTSAQKKSYGDKYDAALRPALAAEAVAEIHDAGVNVDIWKIEALPHEDWRAVISATKHSLRKTQPVFIVLGRNAPVHTVEQWLKDAAPYEEAVGFAVGRTVFYEPLKRYISGSITREVAARQIAMQFRHFAGVWRTAKKAHPPRHHIR